jgi:formylglycine-generating enzyme required for sulfatase activity
LCLDYKGELNNIQSTDPRGPQLGVKIALRGGSWKTPASGCRYFERDSIYPSSPRMDTGLRLVLARNTPRTPIEISKNKVLPVMGKEWSVPDIGLEMIWVEPGSFTMGSPESEALRYSMFETAHKVTLTRGFWMGRYEVTRAQWELLMGGDPCFIKDADRSPRQPINCVCYREAVQFCEALTEYERNAGRLPKGFRYALPTEAQWEYACRAGTKDAFYFGNNTLHLYQYANYCDKSYSQSVEWECNYEYSDWKDNNHDDGHDLTAPVGSYPPNPWGFYDMLGNVAEWCQDGFDRYGAADQTNPMKVSENAEHILRGGSLFDPPAHLRCANRNYGVNNMRWGNVGLRVCLVPE